MAAGVPMTYVFVDCKNCGNRSTMPVASFPTEGFDRAAFEFAGRCQHCGKRSAYTATDVVFTDKPSRT